jgi:hypothetical protein
MNTKKTLVLGAIMITVFFVIITISRMIYSLFWGIPDSDFLLSWWFILSIILAFALHEFVHAILFAIYNPKGWSAVRISMNLKNGILYCHCKGSLKVKYWRIAVIMPLILIGMIPYIISFIWGIYPLMYLSVLMIVGSVKDVEILYRKRNLLSDAYM